MITQKFEPVRVQTADGWVVVLNPSPWNDTYELWIGKVENSSKFYTATVQKDGFLELTETNAGEVHTPTMRISRVVWEGLAQALRGVTPQVDKREVDAELKATKYHLEDMRKLALKKK